jgi:hypothetical protein
MSGFQQDVNQLQPNFYRVVLTLADGEATYPTDDDNYNGAVYTQDHSQFKDLPTTLANARKVARGHLRFLSIIEEVKKFADAQIINVGFDSADTDEADNQPTEVSFTIRYDRDANVLESTKGEDDAGGNEIEETVDAVRQLVVQGICRGGITGYTRRVRVYDPVQEAEVDEFITIEQPDVPADVIEDVQVILVPATTLFPIPSV